MACSEKAWLSSGLIAYLLTGILFTHQAQAFTLASDDDSNLRGWDKEKLAFKVNYSGCSISKTKLNDAIDQAVDLWNSVPSSGLRLKRGSETETTVADVRDVSSREDIEAIDTPVILCDSDMETTLGSDMNNIPGVGFFASIDSRIVFGYMLLNSVEGLDANLSELSSEKIAIVLAHEMGHVLGLGHSGDERALMYFSASEKKTLNLAQDDIDGISYLYPREELGGDQVMGCASLDESGRGGLGAGGGLAALGAFFALAWWSTRSRETSLI